MTQTERELTQIAVRQYSAPIDHDAIKRFSALWDTAIAELMTDGMDFYKANARLHNLCDAACAKAAQ